MKPKDIVEQARRVFDAVLHTAQYKAIVADANHLEALLRMGDARPATHYLDLATGSGYIAFELASRHPTIQVTGLDIATASMDANDCIRREKGIDNLRFVKYDGIHLPFPDASFFGVFCRYALHHFPDPSLAVGELYRVLEGGGFVIIADPITYDEDTDDYIDRFQRLRPDGHVHFFRAHELTTLFHEGGFSVETEFRSTVRYPRGLNDDYLRLLQSTPRAILNLYQVEIEGDVVYSTLAVANVLFRKIQR